LAASVGSCQFREGSTSFFSGGLNDRESSQCAFGSRPPVRLPRNKPKNYKYIPVACVSGFNIKKYSGKTVE
jgi:hypothetical protein